MDISPRDVPLDDDDWVPNEPELEPDIGDELTDTAPLVPRVPAPGRVPPLRGYAALQGSANRA